MLKKPFKHLLLGIGACLIIVSCLTEVPQGTEKKYKDEFVKPVENYTLEGSNSETGAGEMPGKDNTVNVDIPEGASGSDVAALLSEIGLIEDEEAFKKRLMDLRLDRRIIYGVYNIRDGEDIDNIIVIITGDSL